MTLKSIPWHDDAYHHTLYKTSQLTLAIGHLPAQKTTAVHTHTKTALVMLLSATSDSRVTTLDPSSDHTTVTHFDKPSATPFLCPPVTHCVYAPNTSQTFLLIESCPAFQQTPPSSLCITPPATSHAFPHAPFWHAVRISVPPNASARVSSESSDRLPLLRVFVPLDQPLHQLVVLPPPGASIVHLEKGFPEVIHQLLLLSDFFRAEGAATCEVKNVGKCTWTGIVIDIFTDTTSSYNCTPSNV